MEIKSVVSIPVTSIGREHELGEIETGVAALNRLIANVYWGQLSNYLSVPTDCPQRNERLGWTADTQVFAEAGAFNADTAAFLRKWMRDVVDTQHPRVGFASVSPSGTFGGSLMRFGWADAGIIVPYRIWVHFGDETIVRENWQAMKKYMARVNETKYDMEAIKEECRNSQYGDWLSYEALES
ncbi:MAG: glycosyl hydrolase family 18, partial [Kiritimatiellae bacterium]|nr:glycosyl hydrolase family 18 [Kiritimatiellia bacterium]